MIIKGNKKIFTISQLNNLNYHHADEDLGIIEIIKEDYEDWGGYQFSSDLLTGKSNANEIWSIGQFLITLYNGAVNINNHGRILDITSVVKLENLFDWITEDPINDIPQNPMEMTDPFSGMGKTISNSNKKEVKKAGFIAFALYLVKTEDDVKSLLLSAGSEANWVSLYAIYDTIKHYSGTNFGQILKTAEYTNGDIKAFTGTANNFGLLGIMARHGELGFGTPSKTLSFEDSRKMILKLAYEYIKSK